MPGTLPPPDEKAHAVRTMFDRIAPDYDRVNRVLTGGFDQRWRRALLARLAVGDGDLVLDLACGTGDFAEIARERGAGVVALDFSGAMLAAARVRLGTIPLVRGDALNLPLGTATMSAVVSGFALRNFVDLAPAFKEAARVLRPGGRLGLLEVDRPANPLVRAGHGVYFRRVVPVVGGWLSSDRPAYRYLPDSAVYLPDAAGMVRLLRDAGFREIRKRTHMLGAIQSITAVRS